MNVAWTEVSSKSQHYEQTTILPAIRTIASNAVVASPAGSLVESASHSFGKRSLLITLGLSLSEGL